MPVVETALSSRRIQFIQICSHYPFQSYVSLAVIRKWCVLLRNITVSIVIVYTWFNQKKKTTLLASQKQARSGEKILKNWKFNNLYPFTGCLVKKNFSGNTIAPNANNISHYLKSEGWIFPPASQKHARPGKIIYFTENLTTCLHL